MKNTLKYLLLTLCAQPRLDGITDDDVEFYSTLLSSSVLGKTKKDMVPVKKIDGKWTLYRDEQFYVGSELQNNGKNNSDYTKDGYIPVHWDKTDYTWRKDESYVVETTKPNVDETKLHNVESEVYSFEGLDEENIDMYYEKILKNRRYFTASEVAIGRGKNATLIKGGTKMRQDVQKNTWISKDDYDLDLKYFSIKILKARDESDLTSLPLDRIKNLNLYNSVYVPALYELRNDIFSDENVKFKPGDEEAVTSVLGIPVVSKMIDGRLKWKKKVFVWKRKYADDEVYYYNKPGEEPSEYGVLKIDLARHVIRRGDGWVKFRNMNMYVPPYTVIEDTGLNENGERVLNDSDGQIKVVWNDTLKVWQFATLPDE